jgi:glycerol kinase
MLSNRRYGTGCFLLYHVGDKPVISTHGLLSTVAYDFDGKAQYALEGSIAVAGSSVKFLQNNFGFIQSSSEISALAETVEDNGGVTFVTAFSGLFAPYWIDDARGTLFGITAYTQKGHIARATLEATCFQTKAILNAMEKDSGQALAELAVDGGMTKSDLCMQVYPSSPTTRSLSLTTTDTSRSDRDSSRTSKDVGDDCTRCGDRGWLRGRCLGEFRCVEEHQHGRHKDFRAKDQL